MNHSGGEPVTRGNWDTYEDTKTAASRRARGTTQEEQNVAVGGRGSRILATEGLGSRCQGGVILGWRKRKNVRREKWRYKPGLRATSHAMPQATAATLVINTPNINAAQGQHSVFCPDSVCSRPLPVRHNCTPTAIPNEARLPSQASRHPRPIRSPLCVLGS